MRVAEPDAAGMETEVEVDVTELETAEDVVDVDSIGLDDETLELVVLTVDVAALEVEELVAMVLVDAMTELEIEGDGHSPQPHWRASLRTRL